MYSERSSLSIIKHITVTPVAFTHGVMPMHEIMYYIGHSINDYLGSGLIPRGSLSNALVHSIIFNEYPTLKKPNGGVKLLPLLSDGCGPPAKVKTLHFILQSLINSYIRNAISTAR